MAETHSLRESIIEQAGELFREQGYTATSIKQIAKASGCTTAALYYYFEDGKHHILREVIRTSAREAEYPIQPPQAENLEDFLIKLGADLDRRFPKVADRFNWILLQFATLPDQEQRLVQDQVLNLHRMLTEGISRYVADQETAGRLAWLVFCSSFGYQQIFAKLKLGQSVDLSTEAYSRFLAQMVGHGL